MSADTDDAGISCFRFRDKLGNLLLDVRKTMDDTYKQRTENVATIVKQWCKESPDVLR